MGSEKFLCLHICKYCLCTINCIVFLSATFLSSLYYQHIGFLDASPILKFIVSLFVLYSGALTVDLDVHMLCSVSRFVTISAILQRNIDSMNCD